ncbi:hypothetical protein [Haloferula sp. A504]|uniref:hypothetical protein n=1 Tax=Haloferula sp. A504 TaxID=3373601 RepID=UPI0031C31479|nr:hypothetical protein [Verrucomicrobiaceae bacterium E54]
MKIWILVLALTGVLAAGPTESREWTATNGKTVEGSVLRIEGDKAVLKRADGPEVKVPLSLFVEGDRKLLHEHFGIEAGGNATASGAAAAEGLPFEQGEVVGPVDAGDGATYYLYLPKSLKAERKAPLLFYTDAGGGSPRQLQGIREGAEVCGWVTAISVESKNGESVEHNKRVSKACVDHILETLPVDGDRLYFTGNSGGGAMSMFNVDELKGAGGMPNIGYIPQGCDPPKGHYYVLSGGSDFNRYLSAHIGKKFGKDAVHRMHPGGHDGGPQSMRVDGMIWLNARFLEEERRDHAEEALDFEAAVIAMIRDLAGKEPHRAYSMARVLKDDYAISGANLGVVDALLGELGAEPDNVRYHEGLLAIDEFSEDEFAEFGEGGGSKMGHADPKVTRKAEALAEKYQGVPMIEDTFKAMAKPTVGG